MIGNRRQTQRDALKATGAEALTLIQGGQTVVAVAASLGISRTRLYRALYALYPAGDWPAKARDPLLD